MSEKKEIQVYTSYFYKIRFFDEHIIPFSTAMWDPKWYHDNKGPLHCFKDKRNVINGLKAKMLVPGISLSGLCNGPGSCSFKDSSICEFLKGYENQINQYDAIKIIDYLKKVGQQASIDLKIFDKDDKENLDKIIPALIFFETPQNPCSERIKIIEWLARYNIITKEF